MVSFCLKEEDTVNNTDNHRLLSELMSLRTQPVFRTYVCDGSDRIMLCTTNEKVHLSLGKLSEAGLMALVKIFRNKMSGAAELVFSFQPKEGEAQSRNLFVTSTPGERGCEMFHIAPGH
ncbi:MAG: hypothetical protein V4644_02630 [Patescibacteria group bacterium]